MIATFSSKKYSPEKILLFVSILTFITLLCIPLVVQASAPLAVRTLMYKITYKILNPLIVLLFSLATVFFLYGLFENFILKADETLRIKGKDHIIYGLIGMTIMFCVFSIMSFVASTLGIKEFKSSDSVRGGTDINVTLPKDLQK